MNPFMPAETVEPGQAASSPILEPALTLPWTAPPLAQRLADAEHDHLARLASERRWGLSLMLVGWLHLFAFALCYYLTLIHEYHETLGYVSIWCAELAGVWLIFRLCGGSRSAAVPVGTLELLIRRIWIAYFILAFNLGSLNSLRGHELFEFFPAVAPLASFAFLMLTFLVDRRFFAAVPVMFVSGLLMAANLLHAYLVFALAWWFVLNGIGAALIVWKSTAKPGG